MHQLTSFILVLSTAAFITAAPTTDVGLQSLNFPNEFVSMITKREASMPINCPTAPDSCGVVTFRDGQYTSFGQGTCVQLGGNVQTIYVAKCYCSLWNICTGNARKDIFVGGMMMCEKPRHVDTFDKKVKFISCGGLN